MDCAFSDVDDYNADRVVCQNSADRLSGPPIVIVEDPTQSFVAPNLRIDVDDVDVDDAAAIADQSISEPLMVSLDYAREIRTGMPDITG
jgi:hypothetical protein